MTATRPGAFPAQAPPCSTASFIAASAAIRWWCSTSRYICNYLRQQHGVPVCQCLTADPIDARVVQAFFEAVAPAELEVWERSQAAQRQAEEAMARSEAQQIERLRYQAGLAERQFDKVDPDNRNVAAELERRWEAALRELHQAEEGFAQRQASRVRPLEISADVRSAFLETGRRLPALWQDPALGAERKKALLRCLIDKVVAHRCAPDRIAVRIVWRGGATSEMAVEVAVGDLNRLSRGGEMEASILEMARTGMPDDEIACALTGQGHRSPMRDMCWSARSGPSACATKSCAPAANHIRATSRDG
jgi:hypothetical protein